MAKKKKKYLRPTAEAEKEALAWAIEVFRLRRAELEKGNIDREKVRDGLIELHDLSLKNNHDMWSPNIVDPPVPQVLRDISATLLKRDKQLPPGLADYAAKSLEEPDRPER